MNAFQSCFFFSVHHKLRFGHADALFLQWALAEMMLQMDAKLLSEQPQ